MNDAKTMAIFLICLFAWGTHVVYCFTHALYVFLLAGAIFFPIGILHGVYLWFN